MKKLPTEIVTALLNAGQPLEEVRVWMAGDRSLAGEFADTYLVADRERLYILSDQSGGMKEKTFKGFLSPRAFRSGLARPAVPGDKGRSWKLESIPMEQIEAVSIVNLAASGMAVIKGKAGDQAVAAFTNGYMAGATSFAAAVAKLKKGEPLPESERESARDACPKCGMLYPHKDRQICPKCLKKHAIFIRLLALAGKYKLTIGLIVLFMLLNAGTGLVIPYLQGRVLFDQALGDTGAFAGQIGLVILLMVLFRTLSMVFGIAFGVLNARMAANVTFDLKARVFASMQRLSLSFFQRKQTGQLMTRVNNDATELQFFFVDGIPYFVVNAMNIVGIVTILLILDWKLTLICLIPLPIVLVLIRVVFPKLWRLSWRRHRKVSSLNAVISDSMQGTRVIKAFGQERKEMERFQYSNTAFSQAEQSFGKMSSTVFPVLNMLTQLGGILIWAFGGWKVMQGDLTFGMIMTFIGYIYMLFGPIQFMNNIAGWWSYCMSAAQRIFEIQDAVPELAEKPGAVDLKAMQGDIAVSGVTFGYEPNKAILKDVSLRAKPGQMIGIVGKSGAGKSTLVNLISRLYDVTDGEIRIDGVNVKDLSMDCMRRNIGIVSQEVYIFMGSLAENIAYGNPDCTTADIIHAAKIANAHDFIEKLPDGYDTIVGTGGYSLSGGEKQRISIARAILHNPTILILDEATASLDTETELQIQEALEKLVRGRTTIAIAHRLSTLRGADYLVVMDKGKVAEAGTHDELMARAGVYEGLVKKHDEALMMKGVG